MTAVCSPNVYVNYKEEAHVGTSTGEYSRRVRRVRNNGLLAGLSVAALFLTLGQPKAHVDGWDSVWVVFFICIGLSAWRTATRTAEQMVDDHDPTRTP